MRLTFPRKAIQEKNFTSKRPRRFHFDRRGCFFGNCCEQVGMDHCVGTESTAGQKTVIFTFAVMDAALFACFLLDIICNYQHQDAEYKADKAGFHVGVCYMHGKVANETADT